ncbi:MAG: shikimate kinase [Candidatus Binatia bacterium]|nr:MAG: shikimate kinase [Candidatus Binatia bacterium]
MASAGQLRSNIILIGMPGAGKSAVGRLLAHKLRRSFLDTDVLLAERVGQPLGDFLTSFGAERFRQEEEALVLGVAAKSCVVATGGSVVYSVRAMEHLRKLGMVVYLSADFPALERRGLDLVSRGVVRAAGQSLGSLLAERAPLYEKFADLTIDARAGDPAQVAEELVEVLAAVPTRTRQDPVTGGW